jgi:hypothetical protein
MQRGVGFYGVVAAYQKQGIRPDHPHGSSYKTEKPSGQFLSLIVMSH